MLETVFRAGRMLDKVCANRAVSPAPYLDLSSVAACGVKWDLALFSLGRPVVPAALIDYSVPCAHVE